MNWIVAGLVMAGLAAGAEGPTQGAPAYPQWDGAEPIEQYAKRANLPPTQTVDLSNRVKMEFVLVPAGSFQQGLQTPSSIQAHYPSVDWIVVFLGIAGLLIAIVQVVRRFRQHRRIQVSLGIAVMLLFSLAAVVLGGLDLVRYDQLLAQNRLILGRSFPEKHQEVRRAFYLGRVEVTEAQYAALVPDSIMGRDPDPRLPMRDISWRDPSSFCALMARATNASVRLPNETEWEYACLAGRHNEISPPFPKTPQLDHEAWCWFNSGDAVHPVGTKAPNSWGLYDMIGNVSEWCDGSDDSGLYHPLRGGSCAKMDPFPLSYYRILTRPGNTDRNCGFRVLLEIERPK